MKVFSHGSMVNFQPSAREMFPHDLERLIHHFISHTDSVLIGTIDLEQGELRVYGRAKAIQLNESANRATFTYTLLEESDFRVIEHTIEELMISHEAVFDIISEENQTISYRVLYVTFDDEEKQREVTYFFADEHAVAEPLAYVAEFWQQVTDVGRDIDFNVSGCTAHDFNRLLKVDKTVQKCDGCDCE